MNDAEELASLRRLAELEAKASGFQSTGGGAAMGGAKQAVGDRGGQMTDVPNVIGENAQEALTNAGAPPQAAGLGGVIANIGTGMAVGAPAGALVGRGLLGGARLIGSGLNKAKNVIDPWLPGGINRAVARTANAAAGPDKQAIIAALKANQQIVPGSAPTAGQAAAQVGRAEFSGLQEVVKGRLPTEYDQITQAQNAARVNALRTVGKNKAALDAATANRSSTAAQNYGAAGQQLVKSDEILATLMQRPSMEKILSRAKDLAKEQGQPFRFGKDIPEQTVTGSIVGESGTPLTSTTIPASRAEYPVDSLHYIKMAMDDLIKNPERFGIGAAEARAIAGTQKQFVEWLGNKSPAYDLARSTFAAQSKPINQMEVGQYLEGKLTPALNDQGASGSQRAAAYAQALRDAPGTLKRATGQPRYDELSQVLNTTQMGTVESVGQDLARNATHERLAKAGAEKSGEIVGQVTPKVPAAGMFSPHYSVPRAVLNRLAGRVEGKSLTRLAEAMQNPPELAKLMEGMAPRTRSIIARALADELRNNRIATGGGAAVGAALGGYEGAQQ